FACFGFTSAIGLLFDARWSLSWTARFGLLLAFCSIFFRQIVFVILGALMGGVMTLAAAGIHDLRARQKRVAGAGLNEQDGGEGRSMTDDRAPLEERNYQLEREKFQWQKHAYYAQSGVLNKHFGVIITAIFQSRQSQYPICNSTPRTHSLKTRS